MASIIKSTAEKKKAYSDRYVWGHGNKNYDGHPSI